MSIASIASASTALVLSPSIAAAKGSSFDDPTHPRAALARMKQILDALRTRHVTRGWKLNEEAACRALRYFEHTAAGGEADEAEEQAAFAFLSQHGQSLDWVFEGDPTGMICRRAACSNQAATCVVDPIFAAIEWHRAATGELKTLVSEQGRIESADIQAGREMGSSAAAIYASVDAAGDKERDAAWDLVMTEPETLKGIAAMLSYVRETFDRGDRRFADEEYVAALNSSVEAAICRAADFPEPDLPKMLEALSAAL